MAPADAAAAAVVVVADVEMVVVNVGIADTVHDDCAVAVPAVDIPAAGVVIVMTIVS